MNRLAFFLLVMGLGSSLVVGQPEPKPPPPEHQAREKLEALRIWRLTEELNLTEEQSAEFFPRLRRLRLLREERQEKRRALINRLEEGLKSRATAPQLRAMLDSLEAMEEDFRRSETALRRELSRVLTVEQQVRLLLFQEHFERQTRQIIRQLGRPGRPR